MVVAAARELFQKKGFHRTGMAELSDRSTVSVGQIYRLFSTKDDMIVAIVEEDANHRIGRLTEIRDFMLRGELTPRAAFRQAALEVINDEGVSLIIEIFGEGFRSADVAERTEAMCLHYRAMLSEMIMAACPGIEPSLLAAAEEMTLTILLGLTCRSLSQPKLSAEATADFAADMVMSMIAG